MTLDVYHGRKTTMQQQQIRAVQKIDFLFSGGNGIESLQGVSSSEDLK